MSRRGPSRVVLMAMLAAAAACAGALFTAPPGSTIVAIPNPSFIHSHTGASEIMAVITEPAGTLVSDGTVVFFLTDLGVIPPEARTRNGIARTFLRADSRSGTATVRIFSGGPAPAPGASPTPTPIPPPTIGTSGVVTAAGIAAPSAVLDSMNSTTVTVVIGNVLVEAADQIRLRAEPPRITISSSTHIIATVVDVRGNPVAQVPVYFRALPGTPVCLGCEFFDVQAPVFTNNNGEAENVMRTRRQFQGTAQVEVSVPGSGGFITSGPLNIPIL